MTEAITSALAAQRISNDTLMPAGAMADLRALTHSLAGYREPTHGRSVIEILITLVPFILLWLLMWWSLRIGYGIYLLLTVPTAGFLVRLFMIQHDCGHGSFFRHRLVNDWVGRVIGVFTLTPYDLWRRAHGIHHATSGNLDRRGIGDIDTLTVREYLALSRWRRPIPPSHHFVRHRPRISVPPASAPAVRADGWLDALDQHHGNQRRGRTARRWHDVVDRRRAVLARASADCNARWRDRRVAVLCPAPVRAHNMVRRKKLELLGCRALRQLTL